MTRSKPVTIATWLGLGLLAACAPERDPAADDVAVGVEGLSAAPDPLTRTLAGRGADILGRTGAVDANGSGKQVVAAAPRIKLPAIVGPQGIRAIALQDRKQPRLRRDLINNGIVFDARGDNVFFPLPTQIRRFADSDTFAQSVASELNGRVHRLPGGQPVVGGQAVQFGASYWVSPSKQVYRVRDPALALIGGATGKVAVGGREICIDSDGSCSSGMPSYLSPVARRTARLPSHVDTGCTGSGISARCGQYHSFFNKVSLFVFNWARHGANTRLTAGSAGEINRLFTCPAGTPPPRAEAPLSALNVSLQTGGDDLREASHVFLTVTLRNVPGLPAAPVLGELPRVSLNNGVELRNGTLFNAARVPLPAGTLIGHVSSISLFHDSRQRNIFDTRDNWNLDAITVGAEVEIRDSSGPVRVEHMSLVGARGTPLHRFTGDQPRWQRNVSLSEPAEVCFEHVAPAVSLSVFQTRLQARLPVDPSMSRTALVDMAVLPALDGSGVESVETAAFFIGVGAEVSIDPNFVPSPSLGGTAPTDAIVWSTDGVCSQHSSSMGGLGATGNADHDC